MKKKSVMTEKKIQLVYKWIFIPVWNECRNGYFKKPVEINRGLGLIKPPSSLNITEILKFTHLYFPKSIGQLLHDDLPSLDELAKFLLLLKEKNTLEKPAAFVSGIPTAIIEIFCCHLLHWQNSEQNEINMRLFVISQLLR